MSRIAIALLGLLLGTSAAVANEPACASRADLVGPCFDAIGRLQLYDGTPSARIILSHGHRVLGVKPYFTANNETFTAPAAIRAAVTFDRPLSGRFHVCPLSGRAPHRMQTVCIESMAR
ncbi:MAG: hypothetical protein ACREQT_05590 [Candidatus Binataceae bacterium]